MVQSIGKSQVEKNDPLFPALTYRCSLNKGRLGFQENIHKPIAHQGPKKEAFSGKSILTQLLSKSTGGS